MNATVSRRGGGGVEQGGDACVALVGYTRLLSVGNTRLPSLEELFCDGIGIPAQVPPH